MTSTMVDTREAETRNQRRNAVKRAVHTLQIALADERGIPDHSLDQAITQLQRARELRPTSTTSHQPLPRPEIPPGHRRHSSDQYDQLTVWMRLRHTSKPARGYRVQYEGAWTTVTTIGGLQASTIFPYPSRGFTDTKLKQLTHDHLDWNSRQGSPFISIFTDNQHAEDWAMKWSERNGGKTAHVLHIECGKITRLFSVKEVVRSLKIETEMLPEQYEDEYLAVNQIPAEAIVEIKPMYHEAALGAAMEAIHSVQLDVPQPDPEHVRRFSPVRIHQRRSLMLEDGATLGDFVNRSLQGAQEAHPPGASVV